MKTYLIALAASAAFVTAAMAAEMPADTNMQPAPATTTDPVMSANPAPAATTASTPDDKAKLDAKEEVIPAPAPAATASTPEDKAKTEVKPASIDKPIAPAPKKVADEHHAKYHNGEGSTWKTGRNAYGFEGTYGGCQFRGHAGPDGYHIDKAC
jgi:hypothetical protein